ncbi:MAG: glycosyltransferase family 2 protein [Oscillospiraceae bacterium]|nr:glycosyltransferase family 2 protein [Oscillospiraceae bacterium]
MLSLIVPVFNEKENISELVNCLTGALAQKDYEIIFMDDSTDDTPAVITRLAESHDRIRLIHRAHKKGLASAVIEGFKHAQGDILAVMDGDLQHPPALLANMLAEIEQGADIVVPSRFISGGSDGGLSWFRKLASAAARYAGRILLPSLRRISDHTGGMFMFKKEVIKDRRLDPVGWKILMEILVLGNYHVLTEIPYAFEVRNAGQSKFGFKVQMQYLWHLVRLLKRSRSDRRFYMFCLVGASGVLIDMLVFALLNRYFSILSVNERAVISSLSAMTSNFMLNSLFTWRDRSPGRFRLGSKIFLTHLHRFGKYVTVSFSGLLVKSLILFLLYTVLGVDQYLGNFVGIVCASFSNYAFSNWLVWGNVHPLPPVIYRRSAGIKL